MWQLSEPKPVKLICGILACDGHALQRGRDSFLGEFGEADFVKETLEILGLVGFENRVTHKLSGGEKSIYGDYI